MRFLSSLLAFLPLVAGTILENGQPRLNPYPGQASLLTATSNSAWKTYGPNATEISYKGRWDSKHVSWWSAPGIKFGFTGNNVALNFGQYTSDGVLVAYRIDGLDWQFSNVTANTTYHFITAATNGINITTVNNYHSFELRVTNWSYGVQLAGVKVDANGSLIRIPNYSRTIEIIGDSLTAGQYQSYEGVSSWAWGFCEGIGASEYSITVRPNSPASTSTTKSPRRTPEFV